MLRVVFNGPAERLEFRLDGPAYGLSDQPWTPISAPLGKVDLENVRWYVEDFLMLPLGAEVERARRIEKQLRAIGHALYDQVFATRLAGQALERVSEEGGWLEIAAEAGTSAAPLGWPWELLADERGYLSLRTLRVRRTVNRPGIDGKARKPSETGLRVLLVVARPDGAGLVPYDSVEASLRAIGGKPVQLDVCPVGTLAAVEEALNAALDEGRPYDVLHFDGHGNYNAHDGAVLCFEGAPDAGLKLPIDLITPERFSNVVSDARVGLVLLEACRTSTTHAEAPVSAGFAQALLQRGVPAVIAMGYTVHADGTRALCGALYEALAKGRTVGAALNAGRRAMSADKTRRVGFGPLPKRRAVELEDWFVPQLYLAAQGDRRLLAEGVEGAVMATAPRLPESRPGAPRPGAFPPAPPFGFVGRLAELHRLERALHYRPAARIWGLAGMGKTTLARKAAQWLLRTGRVEDAVFVSFRQAASAEHAVSQMSAALLGVERAADQDAMVDAFRRRPVLVVWDNLEVLSEPDMADEAAALDGLFRELTTADGMPPPRGRLLLTSRDQSQFTGAWPVALGGLWRPDARQLLDGVLKRRPTPLTYAEVVRREGEAAAPDGDAEAQEDAGREAVDRLLDALGRHPLSVELVGPSLATERADAIVAGLAEAVAATDDGGGETAERMRALRGALDWSIARLAPEAREALPWLALFRGGVFEQCLLDVSQMPAAPWVVARTALARTGLVRVDEAVQVAGRPHLGLHPTLALLDDGGRSAEAAVRQRFVEVYVAVAMTLNKALTGSQAAFRWALAVFERAEANLCRALGWAEGDRAGLIQRDMVRSLETLGRRGEAQRVGARALRGALGVQAQARAALDRLSADPAGALAELKALAGHLAGQRDADPAETALAAFCWGRALMLLGRVQEAVAPLRTAVTQWRAAVEAQPNNDSRRSNLAATLGDLGQCLQAVGDFDGAETALREGLAISETRGNQRSVTAGWGQLAAMAAAAGRYDDARAGYRRFRAAAERLGDDALVGTAEQHLGILEDRLGNLPSAIRHARAALDRFLAAGDRPSAMQTRNQLGTAYRQQGDRATARAFYAAALADAEALGDARQQAGIQHNLGVLEQTAGEAARAAGDAAAAERHLAAAAGHVEASLALEQRRGDAPAAAMSLFQLGVIRRLQDRPADARAALEAGLAIRARIGAPDRWKDHRQLAEVCAALGDSSAAARHRAEAEVIKAHADYNARRHAFLAGFAQLTAAARDRRGLPADAARERDALAKFPGWFGALAGYFTALADPDTPSPTLPDGVPDELRATIEAVLDGADPTAALPDDVREALGAQAPTPAPTPPDAISLTRALCVALAAPKPSPQLDPILAAMAEADDPTHRLIAAHLTARRRGETPPPLPAELAAVVAEHFAD